MGRIQTIYYACLDVPVSLYYRAEGDEEGSYKEVPCLLRSTR